MFVSKGEHYFAYRREQVARSVDRAARITYPASAMPMRNVIWLCAGPVSYCSREAGCECKGLADLAERRRRHFAQLALESSYNQRRDALHICHARFPQKGKLR